VLAVEDSAPAMEVLTQILLGFGVNRAVKCRSFDDARQAAVATSFDLILVDDDALSEDGARFVSEVRGDPNGCNYTSPVIMLCPSATADRVRRLRDIGAHFVVGKPISPGVLLQRIAWIAHEKRAFVTSDAYRGPDRRFKSQPPPKGIAERRAEALRLMEEPTRALGQGEIDSLF
jgi:DNA-binding response OmpR family regulator